MVEEIGNGDPVRVEAEPVQLHNRIVLRPSLLDHSIGRDVEPDAIGAGFIMDEYRTILPFAHDLEKLDHLFQFRLRHVGRYLHIPHSRRDLVAVG